MKADVGKCHYPGNSINIPQWKVGPARDVLTVNGWRDSGVTSAATGVGVEVTGCEG